MAGETRGWRNHHHQWVLAWWSYIILTLAKMRPQKRIALATFVLVNACLPPSAFSFILDDNSASEVIQKVADRCPGVYSLSALSTLATKIEAWKRQPISPERDPPDQDPRSPASPSDPQLPEWGAWSVQLSMRTDPPGETRTFSGGGGDSLNHKGTQLLVEEFSQNILPIQPDRKERSRIRKERSRMWIWSGEAKDPSRLLRGYSIIGYDETLKSYLNYWTFAIEDADGSTLQPILGPSCLVMKGREEPNGALTFSGEFGNRVLGPQAQHLNAALAAQGQGILVIRVKLSPEWDWSGSRIRGIDEIPFKQTGTVCFPSDRCTRGSCAIPSRKALGRCP